MKSLVVYVFVIFIRSGMNCISKFKIAIFKFVTHPLIYIWVKLETPSLALEVQSLTLETPAFGAIMILTT